MTTNDKLLQQINLFDRLASFGSRGAFLKKISQEYLGDADFPKTNDRATLPSPESSDPDLSNPSADLGFKIAELTQKNQHLLSDVSELDLDSGGQTLIVRELLKMHKTLDHIMKTFGQMPVSEAYSKSRLNKQAQYTGIKVQSTHAAIANNIGDILQQTLLQLPGDASLPQKDTVNSLGSFLANVTQGSDLNQLVSALSNLGHLISQSNFKGTFFATVQKKIASLLNSIKTAYTSKSDEKDIYADNYDPDAKAHIQEANALASRLEASASQWATLSDSEKQKLVSEDLQLLNSMFQKLQASKDESVLQAKNQLSKLIERLQQLRLSWAGPSPRKAI